MSVNNDENEIDISFLCGIFVIPKIKNIMYAIIVVIPIANKFDHYETYLATRQFSVLLTEL